MIFVILQTREQRTIQKEIKLVQKKITIVWISNLESRTFDRNSTQNISYASSCNRTHFTKYRFPLQIIIWKLKIKYKQNTGDWSSQILSLLFWRLLMIITLFMFERRNNSNYNSYISKRWAKIKKYSGSGYQIPGYGGSITILYRHRTTYAVKLAHLFLLKIPNWNRN